MSAADTKGDGGAEFYDAALCFEYMAEHPGSMMTRKPNGKMVVTLAPTAPPSPECSEGVEDWQVEAVARVFAEVEVLALGAPEWDGTVLPWNVEQARTALRAARLRTPPEGAREDVFHDGYRSGYNDALHGKPPSSGAAWCSPEPVGSAPAGVDALDDDARELLRLIASGYSEEAAQFAKRMATDAGTPEGGEADG